MPGRGAVKRSYLKVGVLILVALSALALLALLVSGNTGIFQTNRFEVRAYFKNATGLKVGSPVNLDGVTIGNVRTIHIVTQPKATPVEAILSIGGQYRKNLLTDSRANMNTIGVLGSTVVDIDNTKAHGKPIGNHGVLLTGGVPSLENAMSSFQGTTQKLSKTISEGEVLMSHLSSNKGSIGKLINDSTLRNRAASTVKELTSITAKASEGKGTVGKLMTDDSLMHHLQDMQAKFSDISTAINSGQGTAGKILKDPALGKNLKEASGQLHQISQEARSGQGMVGMMAKDHAFKKTLHDTGSQFHALQAQVNAGKGTMGQIKKNPSLRSHLNDLVENSRKLMTGIRKHPMKYLSIHLRLF